MSFFCSKHYSHSPFHSDSKPKVSIRPTRPAFITPMTSPATKISLSLIYSRQASGVEYLHWTFSIIWNALPIGILIANLIFFRSLLQRIQIT